MKSTHSLRKGCFTAASLLACSLAGHAQSRPIVTVTPAVGYTTGRQSNASSQDGRESGAVTGLTVRISTPLERLQAVFGLEYIQKATPATAKVWYSRFNPVTVEVDSVLTDETRRERYSYVQVPVALQWRILSWADGKWSLYGLAGGSLGYGLERVIVADGGNDVFTSRRKVGKVDDLQRLDFAGLAGLRVARRLGPGSLSYEVRYAHSLAPVVEKRRNRATSYQLGYTFVWPTAKQ